MELNFIHQLVDQVNAAAVVGVKIFSVAGVGDLAGVKPWTGIAHHDEDSMLVVAGHIAFDHFRGIALRSVHDRIGQRLGQGEFNIVLTPRSAIQFTDDIHHATDNWVDSIAITSQRHAELERKLISVETARLRRL